MKKYLILFTVLLAVFVLIAGCSGNNNENIDNNEKNDNSEQLTPVPAEPEVEKVEKVDPVTVVINNHPSARPQSGLQEASIVYEFLVEGGITRFLAVFDTPLPEDIIVGPIRSLRPYLAEQAVGHGGIVAHSGYSERTAEKIRGLNIRGIVSSTYLYRDSSRKAPHNLYSNIGNLYTARGAAEVVEFEPNEPSLPSAAAAGTEIEIKYDATNIVSYTYDSQDEVYLRFVNGSPNTDRESGKQYYAQRVIVRKNSHRHVPKTVLVDIELQGSGTASLYEGGKKYDLTWQNENGVINYFHNDGRAVDLQKGNTWIQVSK